jgi:hypothetical protein
MPVTSHEIRLGNACVAIDERNGALAAIELDDPGTSFVKPRSGLGLARVAVPLDHYQSHFLDVGLHGTPVIEAGECEMGIRLHYPELTSAEGTFPIAVDIELTPSDDGLVMRCSIRNDWDRVLPQLIFPQLIDLDAVAGEVATRLQLGRYRIHPLQQLAMEPDNARWMDGPLQKYVPYADFEFNMKWLDYGGEDSGLTLYSRNTRHTTQGLLVQRADRADTRVHLRWAHYPLLKPGETWTSGEYVLLPHAGDWYAGARAYKQFTDGAYPYNASKRIRETLAIRSMWPAPRNAPPNVRFSGIPEYAEEVADPELGIAEIVLWHWWYRNGYPVTVDPRLGTEEEFAAALRVCEELGVPIVLFMSHHILRDTDETSRDWVHLNAGNQAVINNWTYGRDFLPMFRPPYSGTHAMVNASALSPEWRRIGLEAYARYLALGGKGICFDVGRSWEDPNFNPAIDAAPDEEGEMLIHFAREARKLIRQVAPDGTYSAEHVSDVNVPVLDYTWEWFNGSDIADAAPFRYVFPQFRLNANVNEHPRGALYAFMEGALLNVMPGNMSTYRLRDCPELTRTLRRLAALRASFLRFFTEGQFHFREGVTVDRGEARLYSHGNDLLAIVINPTDSPATIEVSVGPTVWGDPVREGTCTVVGLDGSVIEQDAASRSVFRQRVELGADDLALIVFEGEGN